MKRKSLKIERNTKIPKKNLYNKFSRKWKNNKNNITNKLTNLKLKSKDFKIKFQDYKISTKWNLTIFNKKLTTKKKFSFLKYKFFKRNTINVTTNTTIYNNKQMKIEFLSLRKYKCLTFN